MRISIFIAAAAAGLCLASVAHAEGHYVKAEVGTTVNTEVGTPYGSIELSDEATFGGYIGGAIGPVRVEAGAAHLSGNIDFYGLTVDTSAIDYNATAYLDTASGFYIGAGVDYVVAEAGIGPYSIDQEGFGYHVSGGYAFTAAGGVVELQATYLDASLDDVDVSGPRFTVGYRHAL